MSKRLFFILLIVFVLLIPLTGAVGLAALSPFKPWQPLFGLQNASERALLSLTLDPADRAAEALDLALLRAGDLQSAFSLAGDAGAGEPAGRQAIALDALQADLQMAVGLIARAPVEDGPTLRASLKQALAVIQPIVSAVTFSPRPDAFNAWLAALEQVLADPSRLLSTLPAFGGGLAAGPPPGKAAVPAGAGQVTATAPIPTIWPHFVYFPAGSPGAVHAFFPLDGKHSGLDCIKCHASGAFAGTPNRCIDCHASVEPANHYLADCKLCHTPSGWKPASFDHAGMDVSGCDTCHLRDRPSGHWPGQCSDCHTTRAWKPASFDHRLAAAANCASCHAGNAPAHHYNAQCSACHNTSAWKPARFNHAAVDTGNCAACHNGDKPANHFNGQCSACHGTSAWKPASFNHAVAGATDCASCHAGDKPANHYNGQCSACHGTSGWRPASFNHQVAGATNCAGCHSGDRPNPHFDGQCSNCHGTNTWQGATFSHSFPLDHGRANGDCASCHPSGYNSYTCFTCHDKAETDNHHHEVAGYTTDCVACHANGRKGN